MNENVKFAEANYFYSRMVAEQNSKDNFKHILSAFLSSSRSILQYASEEAKKAKGGQKWFDDWSKQPVLKFFKDKRDINIHAEPVFPVANYKTQATESLGLSDSLFVIVRDKDGNIKSQHSSANWKDSSSEAGEPKSGQIKVEVKYTFADWKGNEDVVTLSQKYLQELETFITDGVNKKYISG